MKSVLARHMLAAVLATTTLPMAAQAADPVHLITREEAGLPAAPKAPASTRNLTRGPGIDAVAPPPIGVSGTFRLAVKFKPRNSVAINPESVRVTYRRQPEVELSMCFYRLFFV